MHEDIKAVAKLPYPADVKVKIKGPKKSLKIRPVKGPVSGRKSGR